MSKNYTTHSTLTNFKEVSEHIDQYTPTWFFFSMIDHSFALESYSDATMAKDVQHYFQDQFISKS